jgi:hypothetical protein
MATWWLTTRARARADKIFFFFDGLEEAGRETSTTARAVVGGR